MELPKKPYPERWARKTGYVLSALVTLLLVADGLADLFAPSIVRGLKRVELYVL
jgi:hypothetical protein